uniref:Unkown protein n=1 Tax=Riptortus pedestris TaxID=329032 RepID=R4WKH4_RIPPE|nr:unkown protein [Riptortus pedestris]
MGSLDKAQLTGFICRICSKMNKVVIHVYGEEGKRINLASQLQTYLGVDVYMNDDLPKTVCPSCIVKLRMYYEWMELIMKTQKEFGNTSNDLKISRVVSLSPIETDDT